MSIPEVPKLKTGDTVDILVMVYPGAIQLRLDSKVRYVSVTGEFVDVEIGTYVLRFRESDLRDWSFLETHRVELVAGSQIEYWPVERYDPEKDG